MVYYKRRFIITDVMHGRRPDRKRPVRGARRRPLWRAGENPCLNLPVADRLAADLPDLLFTAGRHPAAGRRDISYNTNYNTDSATVPCRRTAEGESSGLTKCRAGVIIRRPPSPYFCEVACARILCALPCQTRNAFRHPDADEERPSRYGRPVHLLWHQDVGRRQVGRRAGAGGPGARTPHRGPPHGRLEVGRMGAAQPARQTPSPASW